MKGIKKAKPKKPLLFIGSSKEGLEAARAIELNLHYDVEVTLWTNGVFGLNTGTLESLVKALDRFDFAILVVTPDDVVTSRKSTSQAPRDNVMFELGLFMGRLGRLRTFAVVSESKQLKLPSDLAGVTLARFDPDRSDKDLTSALSPACTKIRSAIKKQGPLQRRSSSFSAKRLLEPTSANSPSEIVIYDSKSGNMESDLIGKDAQLWDEKKQAFDGPFGRGRCSVENGILTVQRTNNVGNYWIQLTRYDYEGESLTQLPKMSCSGKRVLRVKCKARTIGGEHKITFIVKKPSGAWLTNQTVTVLDDWRTFEAQFDIPSNEDCLFRIDDRSPTTEASTLEIASLRLTEERE
ncbi:MAG: TIR domain-containing protein [Verrucomicrobiota bacterium]